jgi:hypothetical protein
LIALLIQKESLEIIKQKKIAASLNEKEKRLISSLESTMVSIALNNWFRMSINLYKSEI